MQSSRRKEKKNRGKNYNVQHKRRGKPEVKWRCHGNAKGNGPSPKKTTLDIFSAKCFSLFDYSSVEEAIHVLKLMLAKNCYGIFRFGPSARGLFEELRSAKIIIIIIIIYTTQ